MPPLLEISSVIIIVIYLISKILHLPFSIIAFVVGASAIPPNAISALIGYIIYRIVCKRFGKSFIDEYKWPFYAGIFIGYGTVTALLITFAIGTKAMWMLPY